MSLRSSAVRLAAPFRQSHSHGMPRSRPRLRSQAPRSMMVPCPLTMRSTRQTPGSGKALEMAALGQKKTFPYPSENGPGATMVAVDQSRRLGPKTWAVYLRISRFAGRLFGVIKALELISFECLHCYFLMVVLVIFQSLSVTRCEKSRFSNELRLVFMGLAFENAN